MVKAISLDLNAEGSSLRWMALFKAIKGHPVGQFPQSKQGTGEHETSQHRLQKQTLTGDSFGTRALLSATQVRTPLIGAWFSSCQNWLVGWSHLCTSFRCCWFVRNTVFEFRYKGEGSHKNAAKRISPLASGTSQPLRARTSASSETRTSDRGCRAMTRYLQTSTCVIDSFAINELYRK